MSTDLSVGVDVTSVGRIAKLSARRPGFVGKLFTAEEAAYCRDRPERLAARWAAKEAVRKVFGSTGRPIPTYSSIAVLHRPGGAPEVTVAGSVVPGLEISLSHDAGLAIAVAVLTGSMEPLTVEQLPLQIVLPDRADSSNKGTFGTALVLAGSPGLPGAAVLACMGALRGGAGKVKAVVGRSSGVDLFPPEVIRLLVSGTVTGYGREAAQEIAEELGSASAVVCGPGLGQEGPVPGFVAAVLEQMADRGERLVVDADGLNVISQSQQLRGGVPPGCVMTPHPLEAARLLSIEVGAVQADRVGTARALARQFGAVIVLKGAGSVVADHSGEVWIDAHATSALAAGGTGDVLSGLIGALLSQGSTPLQAARAGVFMHGEAGTRLARRRGRAGILASEVAEALVEVQESVRRLLEARLQR
ncbi:MAG TPA: NAD(P)H-hydrate dehydratase [Candidatus Dormibacteraeota bacterium]|nr:NAD(P)H-hydrate dehydratase [Candidatus Dormibacteraeota bacterium]